MHYEVPISKEDTHTKNYKTNNNSSFQNNLNIISTEGKTISWPYKQLCENI